MKTATKATYPTTGVHIVAGPDELPTDNGRTQTFVVSASDPRYAIGGWCGRVFAREDGEAWDADGYTVRGSPSGSTTSWTYASKKLD